MNKETLLKIKDFLNRKRPLFKRQNYGLKKRLELKWRAPKGSQSKLRRKKKGHGNYPSVGYRGPRAVRCLTKDGFEQVIVHNTAELCALHPKSQAAVLHSGLGLKKRLAIIEEALKLGVKIVNIKNPQEYLKQQRESLKKKRQEKKQKAKEKPKEKPKKKESIEGKLEKEEMSEEDKKKQEKLEKDKVLTKPK